MTVAFLDRYRFINFNSDCLRLDLLTNVEWICVRTLNFNEVRIEIELDRRWLHRHLWFKLLNFVAVFCFNVVLFLLIICNHTQYIVDQFLSLFR